MRAPAEVKLLASLLEVSKERIRDWPREDLVVYSEHPSYFYDMMTRPMLTQARLWLITALLLCYRLMKVMQGLKLL